MPPTDPAATTAAAGDSPALHWRLCACPAPPIAAIAHLFIAAHLTLDADEAGRVLTQGGREDLAELEQILRATMDATHDRLAAHHPDFEEIYDDADMWWIFDAMTGEPELQIRGEQVLAELDAGRTPPLKDENLRDWYAPLHAKAAITVDQRTETNAAQLRREGHRLIQQQTPPSRPE